MTVSVIPSLQKSFSEMLVMIKENNVARFIFVLFILNIIIFVYLFYNPSAQVIIDPSEITENISSNHSIERFVSITNVGPTLYNINISKIQSNMPTTNSVNTDWLIVGNLSPHNLTKDKIGLFNVTIDPTILSKGDYREFIIINASTSKDNSNQKTIGQIPVVLNVAESKASQTESTPQNDNIINIRGDINITRTGEAPRDC